MTALNSSIVEEYETLGLSPEQIAEQEEIDVTVVKAVLLQCSDKFRQESGGSNRGTLLDFSEDDQIAANDIIRNTMKYSEDENLKAKMALYVRNDRKGRLEPIAQLAKGAPINALVFNIQFEKAKKAIQRAKEKVIDVMATSVTEQSEDKGLTA